MSPENVTCVGQGEFLSAESNEGDWIEEEKSWPLGGGRWTSSMESGLRYVPLLGLLWSSAQAQLPDMGGGGGQDTQERTGG